jgi:hypothetical protein
MLTGAQKVNLALRAALELGIVVALGYWGYAAGSSEGTKMGFLVLFPVVGFGIWGAIDFRQVGKNAEYFRLVQELVISFIAAYGLYASGQAMFALSLAALTIVYHALVYATGERLLKKA